MQGTSSPHSACRHEPGRMKTFSFLAINLTRLERVYSESYNGIAVPANPPSVDTVCASRYGEPNKLYKQKHLCAIITAST